MAAPRQVLGQYAAIALRVPHPLRAQRLCGGFGPSGHILGIRRQLARAITGDQISGNLRNKSLTDFLVKFSQPFQSLPDSDPRQPDFRLLYRN